MTILDAKTDLDDSTTRPDYYGGPDNPYEPVKVIHHLGLGPGFYYGSALKYMQRAGKKTDGSMEWKPNEELSDLKKAQWYLTNGVKLRYDVPRRWEMGMDGEGGDIPLDVVKAWDLPPGLFAPTLLLLNNAPECAARLLHDYVEQRVRELGPTTGSVVYAPDTK